MAAGLVLYTGSASRCKRRKTTCMLAGGDCIVPGCGTHDNSSPNDTHPCIAQISRDGHEAGHGDCGAERTAKVRSNMGQRKP